MESDDEIQLVIKAQKGDRIAFAELIRRYRTAVYAAAYIHLHDHDETEDITQDAILSAYEGISSLKQPCKFGPWLCSIAARKAIKRWTQRKNSLGNMETISEEQRTSSEYDIWAALDADELSKVVDGLVTELSQIHHEAIELYYFQGYTIAEIAKFLDVPVGTVKRRLYDARERLRKILYESGIRGGINEL